MKGNMMKQKQTFFYVCEVTTAIAHNTRVVEKITGLHTHRLTAKEIDLDEIDFNKVCQDIVTPIKDSVRGAVQLVGLNRLSD